MARPIKNRNLLEATRNAYDGFGCLLTERAAVRELILIVASSLLLWHKQSLATVLMLSIALLMLVVESLNSAIERLCDLITLEYNTAIKDIKDLGAGAVFILAMCYAAAFIFYLIEVFNNA